MDLTRAIVEHRTTRIDEFQADQILDKAFFRGHYYSDKPPGQSLLAVPIYALSWSLLTAVRGQTLARQWLWDEHQARSPPRGEYLFTLAVVAVPSAVAAALLFILTKEFTHDQHNAIFATAAYGLGSLAFPYSTMFFTHALSAALLFVSFGLLLRERLVSPTSARLWPVLLSGAAAGFAAITEFATAVPLVMIGLYALWGLGRRGVLPYLSGVLLPAVLLAAYNWFSFGNIAEIAYAHEASEFAAGLGRGFMGVTYPKLAILYQIVFGFYRGLLPLSPVLIIGGIGLYRMWTQRTYRLEAILCGSIVAFFLLFNASYFYWDGGSSFGPRFVIPMLPFACLPMAFGVGKRWILPILLLGISIFHMLVGTAVFPLSPQGVSTLFGYVYPRLMHGYNFHRNWGTQLGLHGRGTLLPLIVLWILSGAILLTRREIRAVQS